MKNQQKTDIVGASPWLLSSVGFLQEKSSPIFSCTRGGISFSAYLTRDSLWIIADSGKGGKFAFRAAFFPTGNVETKEIKEEEENVFFHFVTSLGDFKVTVRFPEKENGLVRYTTSLKPLVPLFIPYWPRDFIPLGAENSLQTIGRIHVQQSGLRSGLLYVTMDQPATGSVFYFQNLTAIGDYCNATRTSLKDTVGGQWPELGFALPPANEKPLPKGIEFAISDALVVVTKEVAGAEMHLARQFLKLHALVYPHLPSSPSVYKNWPVIAKKTLRDLEDCAGCWSYVKGHSYLNAYISDFNTPSESMVQLAVLLPLLEYAEWGGDDLNVIKRIKDSLPNFFDEKIQCIGRWLPIEEEKLDGSEEHKKPRIIDSWYLYHPLMNLSRMALKGDDTAKNLFLKSIDYAVKVARHFEYKWPVFFDVDSLEIIKAESKPGEGGEKDVGGIYAHIMLQAWELTKEDRFLEEAKISAKSLKGSGFDLFYQANNTAFAAGAMLRLWQVTKEKLYLDLSYLCLANLFKNIGLWECRYGHGKHHQSVFALFPLNDAPYTAVYEEHEAFAAFNYYLSLAKEEKEDEVMPAVFILLVEFIRLLAYKAVYYYPPMLPNDILAETSRYGELDPRLWIPLEDLRDGWEACGQVGQQVYGAGQAFTILTRQYKRVEGESFMVFIDYPTMDFLSGKGKLSFFILGDSRLPCKMRLIPGKGKLPPNIVVTESLKGKSEKKIGQLTDEGHMEYLLRGNQSIEIQWEHRLDGKTKKAGKKRKMIAAK